MPCRWPSVTVSRGLVSSTIRIRVVSTRTRRIRLLKNHGFQASMNNVGSWYDNAPMESFIGTLKSAWVHHRQYHTPDEARPDLFFYIEAFYNRRRRHSSLDYLSPEAYEQLYRQLHELRLTPCPQN